MHSRLCGIDVRSYRNISYRAVSRHMFKIYDTNGDGVIDFKEFMTLYFMMSEGSPEEILSGIFRMFDDNGDGSITVDEMNKVRNA